MRRSRSVVFRAATAEVLRAMIFSTAIIIVAYAPLFMMGGVEGKIFEPMAFTMGFALLASIILSISFVPAAAASLFGHRREVEVHSPRFIDWMQQRYRAILEVLIRYPIQTGLVSLLFLGLSGVALAGLGTSFLPTLEENNLWIRVTLPNTVSLEYSGRLASKIRQRICQPAGNPRRGGADRPARRRHRFHRRVQPGIRRLLQDADRTGPCGGPAGGDQAPAEILRRDSRHRRQFLAVHPGQRRRGPVRRQG